MIVQAEAIGNDLDDLACGEVCHWGLEHGLVKVGIERITRLRRELFDAVAREDVGQLAHVPVVGEPERDREREKRE